MSFPQNVKRNTTEVYIREKTKIKYVQSVNGVHLKTNQILMIAAKAVNSFPKKARP